MDYKYATYVYAFNIVDIHATVKYSYCLFKNKIVFNSNLKPICLHIKHRTLRIKGPCIYLWGV